MTSQKNPSKRRLPEWMETVHSKNKKVANSSSSKLQATDKDSMEKIDAKRGKLQFESKIENQDVVDEVRPISVEENPTPLQVNSFISAETLNDSSLKVSAAQVIAQSMPLLAFKGRIVYSCHFDDCACLCDDILSTLSDCTKTVIGFDMEWPVSFQKSSSTKTALIQMCLPDNVCYLFQVSAMLKFPKPLKNLICDSRLMLVGLNIESDLWKLERDFDLRVKPIIDRGSVIDVGKLANQKLKSSEQWTLDGLCKNVLRQRLNKGDELRFGDWSEVPLSDEMKLYGASDAFAGLLLYQHLTGDRQI